MEITIDGPRTIVYLNRVKVTDFKEGQPVPARSAGSHDPDRGRAAGIRLYWLAKSSWTCSLL
jgi:hypothetical protein